MSERNWIEGLAEDHFGADWADAEELRRFVGAVAEKQELASVRRAAVEQQEPAVALLGDYGAEEMLQLVLDTIPGGVFWKDRNSRLVGMNRSFARDIGYDDPTDAVGLDDFDFAAASQAEEYRAVDEEVMSKQRPITRLREPQVRNQATAWLETNKIPLHDRRGKVVGLLGTYADITEQVRYEEKLNSAYAELAQAARFKDQLLAAFSHELRTPLNPILALSESLGSGVYGELDARTQAAADQIGESARQLHQLIEDILDISAFESCDAELVFSPARIGDLVASILAKVGPQAEAKGIALAVGGETRGDDYFFVDSPRLQRVLCLLLENAVKFTPPGGHVVLGASTDAGAGTIAFSVTDDGIGIAQEDLPGLFQTFGQLDRKLDRAYNGAGLGLALVKHMAEQHGGTVAVTSELGEGSCFTVTLPLRTRFEEVQDSPIPVGSG